MATAPQLRAGVELRSQNMVYSSMRLPFHHEPVTITKDYLLNISASISLRVTQTALSRGPGLWVLRAVSTLLSDQGKPFTSWASRLGIGHKCSSYIPTEAINHQIFPKQVVLRLSMRVTKGEVF